MTVSEDSLEPELASVEDAVPELSVEEDEPELSVEEEDPELSVEELPLEPSELVLPLVPALELPWLELASLELPSLELDPLEDPWPVLAVVAPVEAPFELDVEEGAFEGAFRPLVPSVPAEARLAFELLAFGSPAFALELFNVCPWKALAAASVSTPVSTTLPAIIQRFSRRTSRSAASRVCLVCIAMHRSLGGPAKERITRL